MCPVAAAPRNETESPHGLSFVLVAVVVTGCAVSFESDASGDAAEDEGPTPPDLQPDEDGGDGDSGSSTEEGEEEGEDDGGCTFATCGAVDLPEGHCDFWEQDCPPGEKCAPVATLGPHWDDHRCVPIHDDPATTGEPCSVFGNATDGIDTCDAMSMCFKVQQDTLEGTCFAFCQGSENNPVCPPQSQCFLTGDGIVNICIPQCDPLGDDCNDNEVCVDQGPDFSCILDASMGLGLYGAPCSFANTCNSGLYCADPEFVPGCEDENGCCNAFCDLDQPTPCESFGQGLSCIPYFAEDEVPEGLEHLGACQVEP